MPDPTDAPGAPGIPPGWTSSAKTGVGTALGTDSAVWFALSHGIVDEIYYPRIDPLLEIRSRAVVRIHEAGAFPGATVASLSIPWGETKGDEDTGGYHMVWPRDMVESLGGLLACGAVTEVQRGLEYLRTTQEADGHWAQNMWLDGTPYWGGVQIDVRALPVLAVGLALQEGIDLDVAAYWLMVRSAVGAPDEPESEYVVTVAGAAGVREANREEGGDG